MTFSNVGRSESAETYLSDNSGWLCTVNGLDVLGHGFIITALLVQVIAKLPEDDFLLCAIHAGLLRKFDSKMIQIPLIQHLQSLLERLLMISIDLARLA